nr:interleukin-17D [Vulpes vulpes]
MRPSCRSAPLHSARPADDPDPSPSPSPGACADAPLSPRRISYDPARYPKYLPEAYCLCRGCLTGPLGEEDPRFRSAPVYVPTVVLRRTAACAGGRAVYAEEYVSVPVGCTCVPGRPGEAPASAPALSPIFGKHSVSTSSGGMLEQRSPSPQTHLVAGSTARAPDPGWPPADRNRTGGAEVTASREDLPRLLRAHRRQARDSRNCKRVMFMSIEMATDLYN